MNYRKKIALTMSAITGFCLLFASVARGADPDTTTTAAPQQSTNAAPASAEEAKKPVQKAVELGSVNVQGLRASLSASLTTKRNADAIVDAVTATDIGKFPTTNVADALALIPGVTLDHNIPATERVSVDGLDPSLNVSLLDGHPVAQAMWLFGDQPNRGFNFSLLPSELVGKIEVYKSPEARMVEGSLGGLIVMHTIDPLDVKDGTLRGTVGYNYNDMVSQGKPTASGFYSIQNGDGTFGIDISAQHYEQLSGRQGMENYGYTPVSAIAASNPTIQAEVTAGTLKGTDLMPNELSAANFQQTEKRDNVFSNIQYRTSNFESVVSLMYQDDNLDNTNQSTYAWAGLRPGGITSLGNVVNGIVTTGTSLADNKGTALPNGNTDGACIGDTAGACAQKAITLSDNFARGSDIKTQGVDWRTKFSGYDWYITTQVGISDSTNDISQVLKEIAYGGSFSWNLNQGFSFLDPSTANNPQYWADYGWGGNHSLLPYSARDTYGQIDYTKDLDGFFNNIQVGFRYGGHWESQAEYVYGGFTPKTLNQIGYGGLSDLSGLSSLGLSGSMVSHVQTGGFGAIMGANPLSATANYPNNPDANSYFDNTWNVIQENTAAYVQSDFSQGNVHGNIGLRVVSAKITAQGFNVPGDCQSTDNLKCTFPSGYGWVTYNNTHVNVLPAINVADEVTQDVVIRGAASETVAYAPYNQLAPYFEANDTVLTAAAGNPNLKPYESINFDGSAEWYFQPEAVLAGSLFYKKVNNYIVQSATTQSRINGSWTLPGYITNTGQAYINSGQCTAAGVCNYSVTQPVDGGGAKVKGFAVSYQQSFAQTGFGLRANYTYSDATTDSGGALPYNSKNSYSLSPFYEQGPFTASIDYSWRSSYLAGGYVAGAPATDVDSYKDLSASFTYAINDMLAINLSGLNLQNSVYHTYIGNPTELGSEYVTGRQYLASLSFKLN
ncbi:MAG TPA: TonB-dependent receptor [Gammaproteobacteria bacterium]|nr:TonB-dependent receptor [Gammaproteobacteria bacterium]